jgi:hypothetical protein
MPYDVEMPDGTVIQDVPEGTTQAQLAAKYQAHVGGQSQKMSLGDVVSGAAQNFIPSGVNLAKNIYSTIRHPIDTAENLYHLGAGVVEKAIPGQQADEPVADAAGKYLSDRYGGLENIKKTIATDPVGFLADGSVVLGGGGAALKAAGTMAKVGDAATTAGRIANPLALALKGTQLGGKVAGKGISEALGATSGAGGDSIRTAYAAGLKGGAPAQAFADNMRGNVPIENIVNTAQQGMEKLRADRSNDYLAGMGSVNSDPTVLNLSPIDKAVNQTFDINNFKGIDLSPSTAATRQKITDVVDLWKQQNPADFHTAAGLDALKKSVGFILKDTKPGTADYTVAKKAYDAIKGEVTAQVPQYADTMSDYAKASDNLDDLESTLSLGPNANTDTTVRKLQTALRNNVNTSFGRRTTLAQMLADNGAPNLMESIAGQTLSPTHARGLGYALTGGEIASVPSLLATGHYGAAASIVPALAMQSPRLAGEGALAAGKGIGAVKALAKALKVKPGAPENAGLAAQLLGQQNNFVGQH